MRPKRPVRTRLVAVAAGGTLAAAAVLGSQVLNDGVLGVASADVAGAGQEAASTPASAPSDTTAPAPDRSSHQAGDGPGLRVSRSAQRPSRSAARPSLNALKKRDAQVRTGAGSAAGVLTKTGAAQITDPREIARQMIADYGWSESEFSCLDDLWAGESKWDVNATNPTSGAYGIPQALPGSKMAAAGTDWRTNPATQIRWGLNYIQGTYGSPCAAESFKSGHNWY